MYDKTIVRNIENNNSPDPYPIYNRDTQARDRCSHFMSFPMKWTGGLMKEVSKSSGNGITVREFISQ